MSYEFEIIESYTFGGRALNQDVAQEVRDSVRKESGRNDLPEAIIVTADVSHAGYVNNNKWLYTHDGMKDSVQSLLTPYRAPVLVHHNKVGEPIGRTISAEFMEMSPVVDGKVKVFNSDGEEVGEIQMADWVDVKDDVLEQTGIRVGPRIPTGFIRVRARITDPDAIEKIMDGRYYTVSIRGAAKSATCSICDRDLGRQGLCGHKRGKIYVSDSVKSEAYWVVDGVRYKEWSYINEPGDSYAGNRTIELLMDGKVVSKHITTVDPAAEAGDAMDMYDQAAIQYFFQCGETVRELTFSDAREIPMAKNDNSNANTPACIPLAEFIARDDEELNQAIQDNLIEENEVEDAKLTSAARKALPNSAFCYVKEVDGKTIRKFPANDASHVRNGLARLPQSDLSTKDKAKVKACLKSRAKKYGIEVSDASEEDMKYTVSDITLAEATMDQIMDTEVFQEWQASQEVQDDVQTLVQTLTGNRRKMEELEAENKKLQAELMDKEGEVGTLTDENGKLNARIHGDYAARVADQRIRVGLGDAKQYAAIETENGKKEFRDGLIVELQKKSTEYLMDALEDLEQINSQEKTPVQDAAQTPVVNTPAGKVENPGLSVQDNDQTNTGIKTSDSHGDTAQPKDKLSSMFPSLKVDAKTKRK